MKYHFGEKIRRIREKRKITLKTVAIQAGVSESLISQIETNKVSPAIDTLLSIADILDIDFEYLFNDYRKNKNINLVKKDQRNKIIMHDVIYEQLSKTVDKDELHGIEAYYLEIKPGGQKGSKEYGHQGKELGIILEGKGEFTIGNNSYVIGPGDSLSFSSDIPHVLTNLGEKPLKAYWVITPPKMFFKDV